jgi:hypothetical protein
MEACGEVDCPLISGDWGRGESNLYSPTFGAASGGETP